MSNKKKNSSKNDISDRKQRSDYIPFWLQGIEDSSAEITKPVRVKDTSSENKDKKNSEEASEKPSGFKKLSQEKDNKFTNPDWLSELSQSNLDKPPVLGQKDEDYFSEQDDELKHSHIQDEESGEVDIKQNNQEIIPEEVDDSYKEDLSAEDDIVRPEPEEVEITESIDKNINEEVLQDEELPPWLQEMISEPEDISTEQTQANEETFDIEKDEEVPGRELTEPLEMLDEPSISEDSKNKVEERIVDKSAELEEESEQESLEKEIKQEQGETLGTDTTDDEDLEKSFEQKPSGWVPEDIGVADIDLEEEPSPIDTPITIIEGDTQPTDVSEEAPEKEEKIEKQPPEELDQSTKAYAADLSDQENQEQEGLPENLREAQEMLSRNETDEAVDRISSSGDRSTFSKEIQTWLLNASNAIDKPNVKFWELLGDVALENEDHDLAFNAYTKAIKSLLISREETDEIG